jgi:polysaccharide biosynthesis protein PslJ
VLYSAVVNTLSRPAADEIGRPRGRRVAVPASLRWAITAILLGCALGVLVVIVSPLYVVAAILGIAAVVTIFTNIRYGLYGFLVVATLVPFVVIPVQIGVLKLTLIDICLASVTLAWLLGLLAARRETLQGGGIDLPVLLYIGACLTSFVLGTAYGTTTADARLFAEMILGIVLFFVVVNNVNDLPAVQRLLTVTAVGGSLAGIVAILLYFLPAATSTRLLAGLSRVGYPATDILQYDAGTHVLRAIGTSIDPNILGATLMICGVITVGLLVVRQAKRTRLWLVAALAPTLGALLLSYSRGSLVGFLVGCAVIASLRYRRLWLIAGLLVVVLALSGQLAQSSFVTHLQTGIAIQDQATQMRFGEYKDAFRLIAAYPWFGVGFGTAPDIDLYVGVSSIYLLLAENVGLVGFAIWLWAIGDIILQCFRRAVSSSTVASTLAVACLGALFSVLVAGIFDHHFVDIHFPHVVAMVWLVIGLMAVSLRLAASGGPATASPIG